MIVTMARLVEVIASLDEIPVDEAAEVAPTIFARKPWTPASPCLVLAEEAVNGHARSAADHAYLVEVELAREVLEVWSDWRSGAVPSPDEAARAVIHYAEYDAYEPR
jgi:hypothetical protein